MTAALKSLALVLQEPDARQSGLNFKQINAWSAQIIAHLKNNVATKAQVASSTVDLSTIEQEIATLQAEVAALQATRTNRAFPYFA